MRCLSCLFLFFLLSSCVSSGCQSSFVFLVCLFFCFSSTNTQKGNSACFSQLDAPVPASHRASSPPSRPWRWHTRTHARGTLRPQRARACFATAVREDFRGGAIAMRITMEAFRSWDVLCAADHPECWLRLQVFQFQMSTKLSCEACTGSLPAETTPTWSAQFQRKPSLATPRYEPRIGTGWSSRFRYNGVGKVAAAEIVLATS